MISCKHLEDQCLVFKKWLCKRPENLRGNKHARDIGFTNKDLIYRNAFYAYQQLHDKLDWFLLVEEVQNQMEVSACDIHDLHNDSNDYIAYFLAKRKTQPHLFVLALKSGKTILLFLKSFQATKFLEHDAELKAAYDAFCVAYNAPFATNANFFANDPTN
jgi:hypothetical protein